MWTPLLRDGVADSSFGAGKIANAGSRLTNPCSISTRRPIVNRSRLAPPHGVATVLRAHVPIVAHHGMVSTFTWVTPVRGACVIVVAHDILARVGDDSFIATAECAEKSE